MGTPSISQTQSPTNKRTPTMTDRCGWWCAGHNSAWLEKCQWSICSDCSSCPFPSPDVCEWWCRGLEDQCSWQSCSGCHVCTDSPTHSRPTSSPAPSLAPSPSAFTADPCGQSRPWNDISIQSALGMTFRGVTIRTDGGVDLCKDCAVRCWLQMRGLCAGLAWEEGQRRCTYFSRIDGVVIGSATVAVTTTS